MSLKFQRLQLLSGSSRNPDLGIALAGAEDLPADTLPGDRRGTSASQALQKSFFGQWAPQRSVSKTAGRAL